MCIRDSNWTKLRCNHWRLFDTISSPVSKRLCVEEIFQTAREKSQRGILRTKCRKQYKIFRPLSNRESVVRVVVYKRACFATYFHLPRNWDDCLVHKAREQSVRDNIFHELLPLQSVVRTANNENSRMTDRMSDYFDHFFSNNKELGVKEWKKKWVLSTNVFAGFFSSRTQPK